MLSEAKQRVNMRGHRAGLRELWGSGKQGFVSYLKTPTVKRKKNKTCRRFCKLIGLGEVILKPRNNVLKMGKGQERHTPRG